MKTHVGPYRIDELVGRGGMGVVYRGTHEHLRRQVAIKELAPELTRQPEFKERFFSEARTQARLQHPNIVSVFDLIEDEDDFFIVMELVTGRSCDSWLAERAGRGLALGEAVGIFSQVLAALDYAHSEGVIHRDVKPSNILLTPDGRVKLMDFGIALLVGDKRLTASQSSIGTPVYMSPEQILRPREMDHRTDIYSAAIVFFEMLNGAPPFDAESVFEVSKFQVEATPPDLSTLQSGVPPAVARVVLRALAKRPDDRFQSAGEMLRALRDAMTPGSADLTTSPTVPQRPPAPPAPSPAPAPVLPRPSPPPLPGAAGRKPAARRLWVAAGAALLLAFVAFGIAHFAALPAAPPPAEAPAAAATLGPSPSVSPESVSAPPSSRPLEGNLRSTPVAVLTPAEPVAPSHRHEAPRAERQPSEPPRSRPSPAMVDVQTHQLELVRIRETLRQGIEIVRSDIEAQQFTAARSRLSRLQETAVPYRADLIEEVARLHALDEEITTTQISLKTDSLRKESEKEKWQQRLQQIEGLIGEKSYPEARQMATKLAGENGVPETVADRARELAAQADQALKDLFNKTKIKTQDSVVKKPPQ
ncbi:MAG TPA: serine/threonine-protein kinase [Thermoanaerobaculia bacterium]|nr:serine/threonine-protein kinase [Thermoanaerobaculia bacterium]